jgi:uncharacterized membrane-anchored protein
VSLAVVAAGLLLGPGLAFAADGADAPPEQKIAWVAGPARVELGSSLAEVQLPEKLAFAGPADTRKLLESMGNITDGSEMGLIVPKSNDEDWFIVFEWDSAGYVKDDEKDKIDADALLESIKEGTEASNAERTKRGRPALHVVGWAEPPRYDPATHNLTWATLARNDAGHESVNYNVRVLGRAGVMSVTLVDDPKNLAAAKPSVDEVISAFSYKSGKKYAEWVPGDKVAQYGLTALVAAGAGAAALKLGFFGVLAKFFAKAGKLVLFGVVAIAGLVAKFWDRLRGKASARPAPPQGGGA